MRMYSLIFDYNLNKMRDSGRVWSQEGYKNKEYIFSYGAASVATVLHHNPHLPYHIYTDDANLFAEKIDAYRINTSNLILVDIRKELSEWNQHPYCFWAAMMRFHSLLNGEDYILKLDNDLTCLKPVDKLISDEKLVFWKFERNVSRGRLYWGESYAARLAFGTDDFSLYNMGVVGLPKGWQLGARRVRDYCDALTKVDIGPVTGTPIRMWSCSEQTAWCYFAHRNKIPIRECYDYFEHHCYSNSKQGVLDRAEFLKK